MRTHICVGTYFPFFRYLSRNAIVCHMVISCLTYRGITRKFSTVAELVYVSISNIESYKFSTSLTIPDIYIFTAIQMGVKYLIVVLICILFIINDVQNLFICFLIIRVSSLRKSLFKTLPV